MQLEEGEKRTARLDSLLLGESEARIVEDDPVLYNRVLDLGLGVPMGTLNMALSRTTKRAADPAALRGLNGSERRLVLGFVYTRVVQAHNRGTLAFLGMTVGWFLLVGLAVATESWILWWGLVFYSLVGFLPWVGLGQSSLIPDKSWVADILLGLLGPDSEARQAGDKARRELNTSARAREHLASLSSSDFESEVVRVLRHFGYEGQVTGRPGDLGADARLSDSKGRSTVLQVKQWSQGASVGTADLQRLQGSMLHFQADSALFVTLSTYSARAERYARQHGIRIIDGDELVHMWLEAEEAQSRSARDGGQ